MNKKRGRGAGMEEGRERERDKRRKGRRKGEKRKGEGKQADLMKTVWSRLGSCITCWALIHCLLGVYTAPGSFAQC